MYKIIENACNLFFLLVLIVFPIGSVFQIVPIIAISNVLMYPLHMFVRLVSFGIPILAFPIHFITMFGLLMKVKELREWAKWRQ